MRSDERQSPPQTLSRERLQTTMPTTTEKINNMNEIETLKAEGNSFFQEGKIDLAIQAYTNALNKLSNQHSNKDISKQSSQNVQIYCTLLSNRSMCHLKQNDVNATIEDCTKALDTISLSTASTSSSSTLSNNDDISSVIRTTRSKLLYRRAKARSLLVEQSSSLLLSNDKKQQQTIQSMFQNISQAEHDLRDLLSFDVTNNAARTLLQNCASLRSTLLANNHIMDGMTSPLAQAISCIHDYTLEIKEVENKNETIGDHEKQNSTIQTEEYWIKKRDALRFIVASLMDDLPSCAREIMRLKYGISSLASMAFSPLPNDDDDDVTSCENDWNVQYRTFAIQALSRACMDGVFCKEFESQMMNRKGLDDESDQYSNFQFTISNIIQKYIQYDTDEIIMASLSFLIHYILYIHTEEDDSVTLSSSSSLPLEMSHAKSKEYQDKLDKISISKSCLITLTSASHDRCKTMALNVISAWIESNPHTILDSMEDYYADSIHCNTSTSNNSSSTTAKNTRKNQNNRRKRLVEPTEEEIRRMAPRELASYRKSVLDRKVNQITRSKTNAMFFAFDQNGLSTFLTLGVHAADAFWRREYTLAIARLMSSLMGDGNTNHLEDVKEKVQSFLDSNTEKKGITIEVLPDNYDSERDYDKSQQTNESMLEIMKRGLLTISLLLANSDLGSWAIQQGWSQGKSFEEWEKLACSEDRNAMAIASELASVTSGVEATRSWTTQCFSGVGPWKNLLSCSDRDVRSGAASAMAKLGLSNSAISSDEGELFSLLEVAAGLIDDHEDIHNSTFHKKEDESTKKGSSAKHSIAGPVERGIEILSYLSTKTMIKDELAHGYTCSSSISSDSKRLSVIEKLVQLSDSNTSKSSAIAYAIANIFTSISVSIETLRNEAFQGKDITAEQYEQLQSMGKTAEELKLDESKRENDDPAAVKERIKRMGDKNVPRALVNLMKDSSETTMEQVVIAMTRMAGEESVRGCLIQQGCLSACMKVSKSGNTSEIEKRVIRTAEHCIAKLLVTTNPSLLTSAQRMGCIPPLMKLVKDTESTDLQQFEALLSLTNIASYDEETKTRIVSEKGVSVFSYAMFSSNEMVRRAATEAMTNLVPHPDVLNYLQEPDQLKLWVAFASDYENNFECSRAASGCLAMVSIYPEIAIELSKATHLKEMLNTLLECGNLELMHRVLVIILNLVEQGGKCREAVISTGSLAFCDAYVHTYHDEKKLEELKFHPSQLQMFNMTLDLAKEVVMKCKS